MIQLMNSDINNIESYIRKLSSRGFINFDSEENIKRFFNDYMNEFLSNCNYNDIENIRYYTGIAYNQVNSILRGKWDYEKNGVLTNDKKKEALSIANNISNTIHKMSCIPQDIVTYRGVNITSFRKYGITSLEELPKMVNKYYLEDGFTSTSLLRDKSFFNRDLEWHEKCNIEIEYFIPQECSDGIPLINNSLSYSKSQNEYLLNHGSVSKIIDCQIDKENNVAYLKAIFIPERIWNRNYEQHKSKEK